MERFRYYADPEALPAYLARQAEPPTEEELPVLLIWGDNPEALRREKERLDGIYKCVCVTGQKAMEKYLEKHEGANVLHVV